MVYVVWSDAQVQSDRTSNVLKQVTIRGLQLSILKAVCTSSRPGWSEERSVSITSSVQDYQFENGRRYHAYKAGSYPLPNDEVFVPSP